MVPEFKWSIQVWDDVGSTKRGMMFKDTTDGRRAKAVIMHVDLRIAAIHHDLAVTVELNLLIRGDVDRAGEVTRMKRPGSKLI